MQGHQADPSPSGRRGQACFEGLRACACVPSFHACQAVSCRCGTGTPSGSRRARAPDTRAVAPAHTSLLQDPEELAERGQARGCGRGGQRGASARRGLGLRVASWTPSGVTPIPAGPGPPPRALCPALTHHDYAHEDQEELVERGRTHGGGRGHVRPREEICEEVLNPNPGFQEPWLCYDLSLL